MGGLLRVLKNECGISPAFDPQSGSPPPTIEQFDAIWDTGASNCVITQRVIDACGLIATGMAQVHGVHGPSVSETYLVDIYLPNSVAFRGVRVTKGDFPDADILIGMNIISRGDFAVTNYGGLTKFSFRVPSELHIDFVAEFNKKALTSQFQHGGQQKKRAKRAQTFGKNKKKK